MKFERDHGFEKMDTNLENIFTKKSNSKMFVKTVKCSGIDKTTKIKGNEK